MKKQQYLTFLMFLLIFSNVRCQIAKEQLKKYADFKELAGQPLNTNLGPVESVKMVYDLKEKKLYFISYKYYRFHYGFCSEYLGDRNKLEAFNKLNYSTNPNRDYLLGNVNMNAKTNQYFMDLSVFDKMPKESIAAFYEHVKKKVYFGEKLKLLLNTERLLALEDSLKMEIPVMKPSELYESKTFQAISKGMCTGRLRFEDNLDSVPDSRPLLPEDIVVTHGTPKYIPNVSAIILDEFQTPLSHLSILGRNRKIPIAVDLNLIRDTSFRKLAGQWIMLDVSDLDIWYKSTKPRIPEVKNKRPVSLKMDSTCRTLVDLKDFKTAGSDQIGNKAFHFGLMSKVSETGGFKVPEAAFAIPFYFYLKHIDQPKIKQLIASLQKSENTSMDSLKQVLEALQYEIRNTPLDPDLAAAIKTLLQKSHFTTFRFRSSTNAEDAAGFSGAGLYDSKTVDLADSTKTIEKAVLKVWASLWSFEAFRERRLFNFLDDNLAMGILVHRSFPQEEANGVVITKNLYRPDTYLDGMTINVQLGDVSVVEPPQGISCDQLVIVHELEESNFSRIVEYLANSSLTSGKTVLSEEEVKRLELAAKVIRDYFWEKGLHNKKIFSFDLVLDIEFKFQGENRDLYIKQVRFYNE